MTEIMTDVKCEMCALWTSKQQFNLKMRTLRIFIVLLRTSFVLYFLECDSRRKARIPFAIVQLKFQIHISWFFSCCGWGESSEAVCCERRSLSKGRRLVQETDAESVTGGDAGWPGAAD